MDEKIKVNLSYRDYYSLLNDMELFYYVKENGELKQNQFLNQLVVNFYKDDENQNELISSLLDKQLKANIKGNINDLKDSLLSLLATPKNESLIYRSYDCSLSFRPSKENQDVFDYIEANLLKNVSISSYFRSLFHSYLRLSGAEREAVIFSRETNQINEAIEKKRILRLKIGGKEEEFYPFQMRTTKEENFIYVIGLLKGKTIYSFHLYKLKGLTMTTHTFEFSNADKKALTKASSSAIEYANADLIEAKIRLTPLGQKSFRRIWHNRPEPIRIEDGFYFFEAPYQQLLHYFTRFGNEAEVFRPLRLRNDFKHFYEKALKAYTENKTDKETWPNQNKKEV
ncbi:MAG: WYL domain-containing protein [Bacilli bacterium]|jgi:hypothetical protein